MSAALVPCGPQDTSPGPRAASHDTAVSFLQRPIDRNSPVMSHGLVRHEQSHAPKAGLAQSSRKKAWPGPKTLTQSVGDRTRAAATVM